MNKQKTTSWQINEDWWQMGNHTDDYGFKHLDLISALRNYFSYYLGCNPPFTEAKGVIPQIFPNMEEDGTRTTLQLTI